MEFLKNPTELGWLVIGFISILIFIVVMKKGLKVSRGDKSLFIGKQIDEKIESFKKEVAQKNLERLHDEERRKYLFKKSMRIDEHLTADERRTVRRLDNKVAEIFAPYLKSSLPASLVTALIKEELNERLDYNNMKEKLAIKEKAEYCIDIINDIHDKYSTFYLKATELNDGERYPKWEEIENKITELVGDWANRIIDLICEHTSEKVALYKKEKCNFKTEEYIENSITFPIEKNEKYLKELRG